MTLDAAILVASHMLGVLVFGTALLGKLRHRDELVGVVASYRVVPATVAPFAAWVVVILEAAVVVSLGTGLWSQVGATLAVLLLAAFAAAMAINVARGRAQIDCGCFQSALRQHLSVSLIVRNIVLIVLMSPVIYGAPYHGTPGQILDGVGAGVALFVLYQVFNQLLALRSAVDTLRKRFT